MIVCHCRGFNEAAVRECLESKQGETVDVKDIHDELSGDRKELARCGGCMRKNGALREMVNDHNRAVRTLPVLPVTPAPAHP